MKCWDTAEIKKASAQRKKKKDSQKSMHNFFFFLTNYKVQKILKWGDNNIEED